MRHLTLGVQHYDRRVIVPSRGALHLRPANETRLRTVLAVSNESLENVLLNHSASHPICEMQVWRDGFCAFFQGMSYCYVSWKGGIVFCIRLRVRHRSEP